MKGLKRFALLLSLAENLRASGSWCGETHIQKAVYFLQEVLGVPLDFEFILYKHGPFSFDLRDEIAAMQAYELFRLHPQYPYGPSLLPGEGSELIKQRFPKTLEEYANQVKFVAEKLNGKGVADLERLSTALYVTREGKDRNVEARVRRINEIKPHITIDEALAAIQTVDRIIKESEN